MRAARERAAWRSRIPLHGERRRIRAPSVERGIEEVAVCGAPAAAKHVHSVQRHRRVRALETARYVPELPGKRDMYARRECPNERTLLAPSIATRNCPQNQILMTHTCLT